MLLTIDDLSLAISSPFLDEEAAERVARLTCKYLAEFALPSAPRHSHVNELAVTIELSDFPEQSEELLARRCATDIARALVR